MIKCSIVKSREKKMTTPSEDRDKSRREPDERRTDERRTDVMSVKKDKRIGLDNRTGTFRRTGLDRRIEFPFFKSKK
jgi:hypothetical protein